jgi:hypothetical protein
LELGGKGVGIASYMNKILIIGTGSDLSIALELCDRGYQGNLYYYTEGKNKVGYGFDERFGFEIVENIFEVLNQDDFLVVVTDKGFDDLSMALRSDGYKVFGSEINDIEFEGLAMTQDINEHPGAVQVATTAFFNGSEFQLPIMICYDSEFGGFIDWKDECPIFENSLKKSESKLKDIDYRGIISLDGIYTRNKNYYGLDFNSGFSYPQSRIYCKMIKNLDTVLRDVAEGNDCGISLFFDSAYFINAFNEESEDYVFVNKVYELERENSDKFGIAFDKVIMDKDGDVHVLPGDSRMFQMVGFGEDYFEAVDNALKLHKLCKLKVEFMDSKKELIWDLRDRVVFLESWVQ